MNNKNAVHLLITIVSALLFLPFLGGHSLFDWDEINFAESAREMLVSGNYRQVQIGFEPFWEKPPLFIWLQMLSMKIFGINEFAARFPNAICGIVTLNLLYHLGCKIRNHFTGIFWMLAYAGSLAPFVYFRSGIIDPVFNLFIFVAIYQLFQAEKAASQRENPRIHMVFAGFMAGLAVLTKGPVALLLLFVIWLSRLLINPRFVWNGWKNTLLALVACAIPASFWVLPEWIANGPWFFNEFFQYQLTLAKGQIEWHNQPWFYHVVVLLLLCFPSSVLALPSLFRDPEYAGPEKVWSSYMRSTFWVVLIVFSIVTTKIIHYSSLCWFPLAWFAGNAVYRWHTNRGNIPAWTKIPAIVVLLLLSAATVAVPAILSNPALFESIRSLLPKWDVSPLTEDTHWAGWEMGVGFLFFIAGLYWIFKSHKKSGLHPAYIFVFTCVFALLISVIYVPKAAKTLQGKYIEEMKLLSHNNHFVDAWGFKTYAVYFYTSPLPNAFKGEWTLHKKDAEFSGKSNPNTSARLYWLMNKKSTKEIYIVTRRSYQPDWYFNDKFIKVKDLGFYILWKRKDINKADIRM